LANTHIIILFTNSSFFSPLWNAFFFFNFSILYFISYSRSPILRIFLCHLKPLWFFYSLYCSY